ncbi:hypothetical protein [Glycomyces tenuis]|uniref:hypothetical protein n=1 Tax=Glycomyces tenuis TaxID=58116 RepID=UPI0003F73865|nr:hypothetical protein [Glycomyces tenuis]
MRLRSTAILAAALLAAGCTSSDAADDPSGAASERPSASESPSESVSADRPIYGAEVDPHEFCPTGPEVEALESVPENEAVELYHNATVYPDEEGEQAEAGGVSCPYAYMAGEEAVERLDADFATPAAELEVLGEAVEAEPDPSAFPEAPEHFQVTGWEHTGTEEEAAVCLSDTGLLYKECEDGATLVKEVFTLTGFDSNLRVELQVEYRYGGDPASYGSEEAAEVEERSRLIAAEFLAVLIERMPTAG